MRDRIFKSIKNWRSAEAIGLVIKEVRKRFRKLEASSGILNDGTSDKSVRN